MASIDPKYPILFLDFDGVLHEDTSATLTEGKENSFEVEGENLFCWAPILIDILKTYPAKVIIHSSWRWFFDTQSLKNYLPKELAALVVDTTPIEVRRRYYSIRTYLERLFGFKEESYPEYVILDDMGYEFPHLLSNLVECNPKLGVSEVKTQELLRSKLKSAFEKYNLSTQANVAK